MRAQRSSAPVTRCDLDTLRRLLSAVCRGQALECRVGPFPSSDQLIGLLPKHQVVRLCGKERWSASIPLTIDVGRNEENRSWSASQAAPTRRSIIGAKSGRRKWSALDSRTILSASRFCPERLLRTPNYGKPFIATVCDRAGGEIVKGVNDRSRTSSFAGCSSESRNSSTLPRSFAFIRARGRHLSPRLCPGSL